MKTPKYKDLIPLAAARHVLQVDNRTIQTWIKEGMPTAQDTRGRGTMIPIKAATEWASVRRAGPKILKAKAEKSVQDFKLLPVADTRSANAYVRAVSMEKSAHDDYVRCVNEGKNVEIQRVMMKLHIEACKNVHAAKAGEEEFQAWTESLVVEIEDAIRAWIEPVKMAMEAMPRALAAKTNPGEPAPAEKALRAWLEGTMLPLMKEPSIR